MAKNQRGFSLTEALMALVLVITMSSVAVMQLRASRSLIDADKACDLVASQLRFARQISADQRRNVLVEFVGTNRIRLTRQDGGGATTVVSDVLLPSGFTFAIPMGAADTPDGYGNGAPVFFSGDAGGAFLPDGVFVNATNIVLNGSVFTMGAGPSTARAVTLNGASGRTNIYRLEGTSWVAR